MSTSRLVIDYNHTGINSYKSYRHRIEMCGPPEIGECNPGSGTDTSTIKFSTESRFRIKNTGISTENKSPLQKVQALRTHRSRPKFWNRM